jgi:endo-1,4-beta-xylanase
MKTILIAFLLLLFIPQSAKSASWIGNIWRGETEPLDFSIYWRQVTPENSGKWASCEQSRDTWYYWSWLDNAYDYARNKGYPFKEHCLIWGHSSGEPDWICDLSQSEQRAEVEEWINMFGERYSPDLIEVVNEPLHDPPCYTDALGGSGSTGWDWVQWCYEKAGSRVGGIKTLSDYGLLNSSSNASNIKNIKNICGAQAVGAQAHGLESTSASTISSNFNAIGGTVYVSELDLRGSDSEQLQIYQNIFPTLYNKSAGVTLWGYIDGVMWRNKAHLIKSNGSRRPAMDWLCQNYINCGGGSSSSTTTTTAGSYNYYKRRRWKYNRTRKR